MIEVYSHVLAGAIWQKHDDRRERILEEDPGWPVLAVNQAPSGSRCGVPCYMHRLSDGQVAPKPLPAERKGRIMGTDEYRTDVAAIQVLIARQFGSLCWASGKQAAWEMFAADFHPDASLYPAARPAQRQTVQAFVARMRSLAATKLRTASTGPTPTSSLIR